MGQFLRMSSNDLAARPAIIVGQKWRHKRDHGRTVEITGLGAEIGEPYRYAQVKRNTSRRRQSIRFDTLRRDYELYREA